ncbi:uncharacterized protein LOC109827316 [Asparagus officinalis]|uniref:uncharacterized protein LOC109827316 n=1 Tax=Asparagus officinalis TaxID=4686 RepID=UPI00098DF7E7|nr:uncharacterized protein LOC109827316 [Asparagus officinalis]
MKEHETITEMITRFTDITNSLIGLGKGYTQLEMVRKVLRALTPEWEKKKIAIEEANNLSTLTLEDLIRNLMAYEVQLKDRRDREQLEKKIITLNASYDNNESDEDDEDIDALSRKFKKFLIQRHQCKGKHLFILEGIIEGGSVEEEKGDVSRDEQEDLAIELAESLVKRAPSISVQSLSGISASHTIRVVGYYKNQDINILIDSGSTHNFINAKLVKRRGQFVTEYNNFDVLVASGELIKGAGLCSVSLQESTTGTNLEGLPDGMHKLIQEFDVIFQELPHLPPTREIDHQIPLEAGTKPVCIRPYRHAHFLKQEIEKQIEEMLKKGIIRPSHGPLSSPVVMPLTQLLKKRNFTWNIHAEDAFKSLKLSLTNALVLAMSDFNITIVIECDASGNGVGAVLMQRERPIAYFRFALKGKNATLSTYEKELLAIILSTKRLNKAADGLSRIHESDIGISAISTIKSNWIEDIKHMTLHRLRRVFYWKGMKGDVQKYIQACDVCQRTKGENVASLGLLQPLPIPDYVWEDFSMDFITNLPKSEVFKLHGMPRSIVSDRDLVFTKWGKWFPLAEFWYNTTWKVSTNTTPFEAVYGRPPPSLLSYIPKSCKVESVDEALFSKDIVVQFIKDSLKKASAQMKKFPDKHRSHRDFEVGDMVFLKLQPYRKLCVSSYKTHKLSPKYYGPYQVLEKIGEVAYRLDLPAHAQIHPVFHISQFKKRIGSDIILQNDFTNYVIELVDEQEEIVDRRSIVK